MVEGQNEKQECIKGFRAHKNGRQGSLCTMVYIMDRKYNKMKRGRKDILVFHFLCSHSVHSSFLTESNTKLHSGYR